MTRPLFKQGCLLQVRRIIMISCLIQTISASWTASLAEETDPFASPEQQMRAGITAYKRGDFEQARQHWNQVAYSYAEPGQTPQQIEVLLCLAESQEALGYYQPAVNTLEQALTLATKTADAKRLAQVAGSLGHAYRLLGSAEKAEQYTLEDVTRARQQKQATLLATNLNYLGQVRFHQKRYEEAIKAFSEGASLATKHGQVVLAAKAAIDITWVAVEDKGFVIPAMQAEIDKRPYMVHIATHGQFGRDSHNTFLLTFNDRLTMDRLEQFLAPSQFRETPVELLTLSACETPSEDDRAALGLAGVAIKAGARSALASLWSVNDESTSLLMTEFY
jgi:CHAT domain-containing protein